VLDVPGGEHYYRLETPGQHPEEWSVIQSADEAIRLVQDASQAEHDREQAVHYLQHHVTPEGVQAMVQALEADEFSVRWAAAVALAAVGDAALRPLVTALANPDNSSRLREGALHVFRQSNSRTMHEKTGELQHVLRGIDADMRTMEAAYRLLTELNR
jgi:HEAT repeat protein